MAELWGDGFWAAAGAFTGTAALSALALLAFRLLVLTGLKGLGADMVLAVIHGKCDRCRETTSVTKADGGTYRWLCAKCLQLARPQPGPKHEVRK